MKIMLAVILILAALMVPQTAAAARYPAAVPLASGKSPSVTSMMLAVASSARGTKRARGRGGR